MYFSRAPTSGSTVGVTLSSELPPGKSHSTCLLAEPLKLPMSDPFYYLPASMSGTPLSFRQVYLQASSVVPRYPACVLRICANEPVRFLLFQVDTGILSGERKCFSNGLL